ncbi:MAG: serine protease [Planctomycetota bacterium]|nr:serine protease [Planctomycetota bacterium]
MRIECPICEFQSELDSTVDLSQPLICKTCHKTFPFSSELVVQSSQKIPPAAIVKPSFTKISTVPEPPAPSIHDAKREGETTVKIASRRAQKRMKQAVVLALLGLVALVLIGLIAFSSSIRETLAGYSEQRDPIESASRDQTDVPAKRRLRGDEQAKQKTPEMGDLSNTPAIKRPKPETTPDVSSKTKKEPVIVFPEPKPRIYSGKSIGDTWLKVQPHLVELTGETAFGEIHATGILIDSRGWVLTSYRAIQGATEITVSQSRKSMEEPKGELTDLVRGVIASDADHDLVILKVNRRFVTEFRDLPIAERDVIVPRQYLIQCVPPSQSYPWPAVECPVESRKTYAELGEREQQQLRDIGYGENSTSWILHPVPSPRNRGAALVNEQGELVGMTVEAFPVKSGTDLCLAIPAEHILDLKQQANNTSTPLPLAEVNRRAANQPTANHAPDPEPATAVNKDEAGGPPEEAGSLTILPKESPWYDLSLELNRAGRTCSQFGWWPGNDDQTANLQNFVDQLATTERVIAEKQSENESETALLQNQIDYWWRQFSAGFQPTDGLSETAQAKLNQRYEKGSQNESILNLVGFAKVHIPLSEGVLVNEEPCVTFQLLGTKALLTAPADDVWPALRPGANCLFVAELQPGVLFITDPANKATEPSLMAKIRFLKRLAPQP